jgi:hypothetical protein
LTGGVATTIQHRPTQGGKPGGKALFQLIEIEAGNHPAKGIVGGNAVGQVKKPAQPGAFRSAKRFYRNPVIRPTDDGTDGDDEHIEQGVRSIPIDARVIDVDEMSLDTGHWHGCHNGILLVILSSPMLVSIIPDRYQVCHAMDTAWI